MVHLDTQFRPTTAPPEESAAAALRQLIMGFRTTQMIYAAARLGVADALAHGPRSAAQVATEVGAERRALYRLLRALASIGIFAETPDGSFAMTPLADALRTDAPGSLRSLAVLYGEEWLWCAYGRTLQSVRSGQPAFADANGDTLYDYLDRDASAAAMFHEAMSGYSAQEASAIVAAYDLSDGHRVVDVGGGHGTLVAAMLQAHAHLTGVVFDLPAVLGGAERRFADAGLAARAACVAGDFFATVPDGGDVYVLKSVLHNWDDAACLTILRACRRAMTQQARLLVIERLIPPGNAPSEAKLFDINMLVVAGGRERTDGEYRALLRSANFDLTRIVQTRSAHSLIEAVPVHE